MSQWSMTLFDHIVPALIDGHRTLQTTHDSARLILLHSLPLVWQSR